MDRTRLSRGIRLPESMRRFLDPDLPGGTGWAHTLGTILLAGFALQFFTGLLLALNYSPSGQSAWESVRFIEGQVRFGSFLRGLHHWGASAMVILTALHLLRVFAWGAYRGERRWTWVAGVALLGVVLAFGFTGYLLPWDLKAFFGTKVGVEVARTIPFAGDAMARMLAGGRDIGSRTLARFYATHVILLPSIAFLLLLLHVFLVRARGIFPTASTFPSRVGPAGPYVPAQLLRDAVAVLLLVLALAALAVWQGAPLEPKADVTNTDYVPGPEWYFYGLQFLLGVFGGRSQILGTLVLPGLFATALLLLPFWDRSPSSRPGNRAGVLVLGFGALVVVVALTVAGGLEHRRETARAGRATSAPGDIVVADAGLPSRGEQLWARYECGYCHGNPLRREGPGIPPDLSMAGSRLETPWIVSYLLAPYPRRWKAENVRPEIEMPDLDLPVEDALELAAWLGTRLDTKRFPARDWDLEEEAKILEGKDLFRLYSCGGCHRVGERGGYVGPDLTWAGDRLKPEFVFTMIKDPELVIPGTAMENLGLWDLEAEAVTAYLMSLSKERRVERGEPGDGHGEGQD